MDDYEHTLTVAIKALSELIEDNRRLAGKLELLELAYEGCTGHKPDYKSLSNLYSKDGATIEALRESKPSTAVSQSEIENIIYSVMATDCQHDGAKFVKSVSERIFKLITGGN